MNVHFSTTQYLKEAIILSILGSILFGGGLFWALSIQVKGPVIWIFSIFFIMGLIYLFGAIRSRSKISLETHYLTLKIRLYEKQYRYSDIVGLEDHTFDGFYIIFKDGFKFHISSKFQMDSDEPEAVEVLNASDEYANFRAVTMIKNLLTVHIEKSREN